MKVEPLDQVGGSKTMSVTTTYRKIVEKLGFGPNVEDDPDKVEASWGFQDKEGRQAFLWCYKQSKDSCTHWSADGDRSLLVDLFGAGKVSQY